MTDGAVHIENLHVEIENVIFMPGTAPEATSEEISDFIREQREAGALTIRGEDGLPLTDESAEPDNTPTPEQQEEIDRIKAEELAVRHASPKVAARAKELHKVAKHVSEARKLEGYKKSYAHPPKDHESLKKRQKNAVEVAGMDLERACALCEFSGNCVLQGRIEKWIDVHAYKDDRTGKRRPGSSDVEKVESRNLFEKALDAGVEANEQVHCDPAERE